MGVPLAENFHLRGISNSVATLARCQGSIRVAFTRK
jgi:hypothetical protein